MSAADVLLLDEPTNHLDLETTRWLEEYLRNTDKTILLISHDRAFLANVVDHVLHLEGGSAVAYTGGYEAFVAQRAERRLSQERAFEKQRKVIADEEDYIRRNIAGQNTKQAKGRRKRLSRMPRLSGPTSEEGSAMGLRLDLSERGGDQVAIARDVDDHSRRSDAHQGLHRDHSARRSRRLRGSERKREVDLSTRAGWRARDCGRRAENRRVGAAELLPAGHGAGAH